MLTIIHSIVWNILLLVIPFLINKLSWTIRLSNIQICLYYFNFHQDQNCWRMDKELKRFLAVMFLLYEYLLIFLWCKASTLILSFYKDLKVSFLSFLEHLWSSSSGRYSEIRVILFWRKFLHTIFKIFVPGLWHVFNMKSCGYMTLDTCVLSRSLVLIRTIFFVKVCIRYSCRKCSSCHFILMEDDQVFNGIRSFLSRLLNNEYRVFFSFFVVSTLYHFGFVLSSVFLDYFLFFSSFSVLNFVIL